MSKEISEMYAVRLMKQDRLTTEEIQDMEASADIFGSRSHAAHRIAQDMRRNADAMQQEAQRLRALADQIAAIPNADKVRSKERAEIKVFK